MLEMIVRARRAPTDPGRFRAGLGSDMHLEYLAQIMINTLFVSKSHRSDTVLTLVLEGSSDFSRVLSFAGDRLGSLGDQREASLLQVIIDGLRAGASLAKEAAVEDQHGTAVQALSFERLVKARLTSHPVFLLDRKGEDIRSVPLPEHCSFLMTDHVPMPRKIAGSLLRQGARALSLGPVMLHTSQCVVLIQNELDRRGVSSG